MSEEAQTANPVEAPNVWSDALRKPFDPKVVGKMQRGQATLSYVGHAAVTDRLLTVDPLWNWEPAQLDQDGFPKFIRAQAGNPLGLWIRLTVCGVTRMGYGSVLPNAFDPEKQLIGDAIRNAAMRFGVALDLWSKDELESHIEPGPSEAMQEAREHAKKLKASSPSKKPQPWTEGEKEEQAEVLGAPAGEWVAKGPRVVCGVSVWRTWADVSEAPIGAHAANYAGGVASSKDVATKTWSWASEGTQNGEREQWLEKLVAKARELYSAKPAEPLPTNLQAAVLSYFTMQGMRSPPPASLSTGPVTPEEV